MELNSTCLAWRAVIKRLHYLDVHGRRDIDLFAHILTRAENGDADWRALLPPTFDIWVVWAERQLALEQHFPHGTRLGTLLHSPVLRLRDLRDEVGVSNVRDWRSYERDLRVRTGLAAKLDAQMQRHAGYSVKKYIVMLRQTNKQDPVAIQLLMAKEFERCAEHWGCKRTSAGLFDLTSVTQDQRWLLLAGAALADHARLLAIVRALWRDRRVDHVMLRNALNEIEEGFAISDPDVARYVETAIFSVPAMMTVARLHRIDRIAMLREIVRILTPKSDGRGGERTRRELSHYYGLVWQRLLAVGMVEIVTTTADLMRKTASSSDLTRTTQSADYPVGVAGKIIDVITTQERWPQRSWSEARRVVKYARREYLRQTWELGGGGRLDPRLWMHSERDAKTYKLLSVPRRIRSSCKKNLDKRNFVQRQRSARRRLNVAMFGLAGRALLNQKAHRSDLVARAMAQMAASHSHVTNDPVFIPMARHQLAVTGYDSNRGIAKKGYPFPQPVSAGRKVFGCRIAGSNAPQLRVPDFPPEGVITVEIINAWTAPSETSRALL